MLASMSTSHLIFMSSVQVVILKQKKMTWHKLIVVTCFFLDVPDLDKERRFSEGSGDTTACVCLFASLSGCWL